MNTFFTSFSHLPENYIYHGSETKTDARVKHHKPYTMQPLPYNNHSKQTQRLCLQVLPSLAVPNVKLIDKGKKKTEGVSQQLVARVPACQRCLAYVAKVDRNKLCGRRCQCGAGLRVSSMFEKLKDQVVKLSNPKVFQNTLNHRKKQLFWGVLGGHSLFAIVGTPTFSPLLPAVVQDVVRFLRNGS